MAVAAVPRHLALVPLIVGIQRYLEYAYQKQRQRVQEKDVALLALLSEPLREDLKHATFARHLSAHPLFQHCEERTRIFGRALAAKSLAAGDLIFACGEQARRVVFLTGGTLEYTRGEMGDSPSGQTGNSEAILENQWVGEAVLWTTWLHLGDLVAITESQIITIDAGVFGDQVQINRPLWLAVQHYATKFVSALNQVTREDLTDLIDRLFPPSEAIDMLDFFDQSSTAHNANDNFVGTVSYVGIWERISSSLFGRQNGIENVQNMSSIGVAAP